MPSASATLPASTRADSFRGVLAGCSAHALWGVAVLYWRLLAELPAVSILAHRMAWSCLFVLAVLIVLPLDLLSMKVCVLLTAMPAANTTVMLAGKYDRDPAFASELVMTSTLLSLFTIPLISGLLSLI